MKLNNFQNFALSTQEQNNVTGGNWFEIRRNLMPHYGTPVSNYSTEAEMQFNPFTGQMEASNYITLTVEFNDNTGESFQIAQKDFDLCFGRIDSIFKLT